MGYFQENFSTKWTSFFHKEFPSDYQLHIVIFAKLLQNPKSSLKPAHKPFFFSVVL